MQAVIMLTDPTDWAVAVDGYVIEPQTVNFNFIGDPDDPDPNRLTHSYTFPAPVQAFAFDVTDDFTQPLDMRWNGDQAVDLRGDGFRGFILGVPTQTLTFTAQPDANFTLELADIRWRPAWDVVTPEPSSALLLSLGMLGLVWIRVRGLVSKAARRRASRR